MVVLKADRSIHLCIDYHRLNEVTAFDVFPMLQVDDMLEREAKPDIYPPWI